MALKISIDGLAARCQTRCQTSKSRTIVTTVVNPPTTYSAKGLNEREKTKCQFIQSPIIE
jgi:hypothetical protein